ncbi:Extracellular matrix protein fras1 [Geranomyces michiganensis]|nr:Extracellular matrix protein fras1 [Geranomyces michiganensis]
MATCDPKAYVCYFGEESFNIITDSPATTYADFPPTAPKFYTGCQGIMVGNDFGIDGPYPLVGWWWYGGQQKVDYYSTVRITKAGIASRSFGYQGPTCYSGRAGITYSNVPRIGYLAFNFTYSDGYNPSQSGTLRLWWNSPPVLVNNTGLRLPPTYTFATQTLLNTSLSWTDGDNATSQLVITLVRAPAQVRLVFVPDLLATPIELSSGAKFTMDDINNERLVLQFPTATPAGLLDSFACNVTDGAWASSPLTTFNILLDDAPALSANNSLTFDWARSPFSATITSANLAYTDRYQTASQLTYFVTKSPTMGQLQLRVGSSTVKLSNETYCLTCAGQPGCATCKYTFTQNDINTGMLSVSGTPLAGTPTDSFTYRISDGLNNVTDQTFVFTMWTAPSIALSTSLTMSGGSPSIVFTGSQLSATSQQPGIGPDYMTYTLNAPVSTIAVLARYNGSDWVPLSPGSTWTQTDVINGSLRVGRTGVYRDVGLASYSAAVSDTRSSVNATFSVKIVGPLTLKVPNPMIVGPGVFNISERDLGPASPHTTVFNYYLYSTVYWVPTTDLVICSSAGSCGTSMSFQYYEVGNSNLLQTGGYFKGTFDGRPTNLRNVMLIVDDGVNPKIYLTIRRMADAFFTGPVTFVTGQFNRTVLKLNVEDPELPVVATPYNPAQIVLTGSPGIYERLDGEGRWTRISSNWTLSEMRAGNISYTPQSTSERPVIVYRNPWRTYSAALSPIVVQPPTLNPSMILLGVNQTVASTPMTASLSTDYTTTYPAFLNLYGPGYSVNYTMMSLPEGITIACNTTVASPVLTASLNGATTFEVGTTFTQADIKNGGLVFSAQGAAIVTNFTVAVSDGLNGRSSVQFTAIVDAGPLGNFGTGLLKMPVSGSAVLTTDSLRHTTAAGFIAYIIRSMPPGMGIRGQDGALAVGDSFSLWQVQSEMISVTWMQSGPMTSNGTIELEVASSAFWDLKTNATLTVYPEPVSSSTSSTVASSTTLSSSSSMSATTSSASTSGSTTPSSAAASISISPTSGGDSSSSVTSTYSTKPTSAITRPMPQPTASSVSTDGAATVAEGPTTPPSFEHTTSTTMTAATDKPDNGDAAPAPAAKLLGVGTTTVVAVGAGGGVAAIAGVAAIFYFKSRARSLRGQLVAQAQVPAST